MTPKVVRFRLEEVVRALLNGEMPVGDDYVPTQPLLLDAKQAARMLSIGHRKLWALTNSGQIPHVRIGRSVRYSIDDLKCWIESKKGVKNEAHLS